MNEQALLFLGRDDRNKHNLEVANGVLKNMWTVELDPSGIVTPLPIKHNSASVVSVAELVPPVVRLNSSDIAITALWTNSRYPLRLEFDPDGLGDGISSGLLDYDAAYALADIELERHNLKSPLLGKREEVLKEDMQKYKISSKEGRYEQMTRYLEKIGGIAVLSSTHVEFLSIAIRLYEDRQLKV